MYKFYIEMIRLLNDRGEEIFNGLFDMSNENIPINNNQKYFFKIINDKMCMGDIKATLFMNDKFCKEIQVQEGKQGLIPFTTGVGDNVFVRINPL